MRALWFVFLVGAGCRLDFNALPDASAPDVAPGFVVIRGAVSGLTGTGLVLENNGADDLAISADGPFAFATPIAMGAAYTVSVRTQPSSQACSIANASGLADGTTSANIEVTCYAGGACPAGPLSFTASGMFTLPAGCSSLTVDAYGGGGAAGGNNQGTAAAGGAGGHATMTFTGQPSDTTYTITIGLGGTCASMAATPGGYAGGGGGHNSGGGNGVAGAGTTAPPGGLGGAGSTGSSQPGGAGGNGGYGGGGGGGGGDNVVGNSAGGATTFQLASPLTDYVVAGGGGAAGASDQPGDVAGAGGNACSGYGGANGQAAVAGTRSGGGGGGGACYCLGGTCGATPTSTGGAGGAVTTTFSCSAAQNGEPGRLVISFP